MAPLLRLLSICISPTLLSRLPVRVPLLSLGLVRPGLFHRRGRLFGFVGEAAFAFRDPGQFLRVLFQRVDTAAVVDHFFAFVEQALQVHLKSSPRGNLDQKLTAPAQRALHCLPMAIQGGQNVVLCASPAVVVVAVITEAELVKSSVLV
jgi:hypothetical protein